MLKLNGKTLLLGGFHDHWSRAGGRNPALLLASLDYYHYDFVTLMDGSPHDSVHVAAAARLSKRIRIYPGREEAFGWGHVVTVNPRGPKSGADDGDYRATLLRLKETCDLVMLAHPEYPGTWETLVQTGEMDRLMDDGVIDGINLINTNGFEVPRLQELIAWFNARDARGCHTPIVGGWDAHLVLPRRGLPPVLYGGDQSPRGHIDTCGHNRTLLFCEENSLPAIVDAVRRGQTVIEDLKTGHLVGPRPLVTFLRESDYAGAVARLDRARDTVQLTIPSPWIAGEEATFACNQAGTVSVAVPTTDGLSAARTEPLAIHDARLFTTAPPRPLATEAGQSVALDWPAQPAARNQDYAVVALHTTDGAERFWAVETHHPIQLELLPCYRAGVAGVEFRGSRPFHGQATIEIEDGPRWSGELALPFWLPVPDVAEKDFIRRARWRAQLPNGIAREEETTLTFLAAQAFRGSWDQVPVYPVADPRFAPSSAYGASRPYPGPDVFAVYLQFAWDESALHVRFRVRDAIHYQPASGHYTYNADCLQLAFDPLLRRQTSIGHVYSFNLALTPQGPELYRWLGPSEESTPGFTAPAGDVSLGAKYLKIEPWSGGLVYDLRLPWSELAPAAGAAGARLGLYFLAFNNDGHGLIDTLHWPIHYPGMWLVPGRWGVLNLV